MSSFKLNAVKINNAIIRQDDLFHWMDALLIIISVLAISLGAFMFFYK